MKDTVCFIHDHLLATIKIVMAKMNCEYRQVRRDKNDSIRQNKRMWTTEKSCRRAYKSKEGAVTKMAKASSYQQIWSVTEVSSSVW